jgi:hypothetical protein
MKVFLKSHRYNELNYISPISNSTSMAFTEICGGTGMWTALFREVREVWMGWANVLIPPSRSQRRKDFISKDSEHGVWAFPAQLWQTSVAFLCRGV